jgi:hypothetical protein
MTISATTQGIKPGVCLSTAKPVNPFDGQVIYMTDVDQTAVWDGTQWTVLAPIASGRNVVINGAMQVAQRGTSVASITADGYYTADRFVTALGTLGTYTQSVEADAPTGSGLRNSLKMLCTTADASPAAGDFFIVGTKLEGQNVQQFLKGTASAKQFALSFWVKGTTTGTYIAELEDYDNTRTVSASYSIISANTWEKKTIVFPADTSGTFNNDNGVSLALNFWLGAGTTFSSGTLQTTWGATTNANRAVGVTNLSGATSRSWQITGVQLEAGAVATPFEFEDYSTTLEKCQRYYFRFANGAGETPWVLAYARSTTVLDAVLQFPVQMRTAPTAIEFSSIGALQPTLVLTAVSALTFINSSPHTANLVATTTGLTQYRTYFISNNGSGYIAFTAEL